MLAAREIEGPHYVALSFDAVNTMLRDHETFSSSGYNDVLEAVFGRSIIAMDEPEHHERRALVQQAFRPASMARWERDITRPIVDRVIDTFAARGSADLVGELAMEFPVRVIAEILGLPEDELDRFHRLAIQIVLIFHDPTAGLDASRELREMFGGLLDERRRRPRADVVTDLCNAELHGERLSDDEIQSFLLTLLPAGAETTYRGTANLLFALLTHSDQLAAVRRERSLVPAAIEESLRWESSPTQIGRTTNRSTVLDGVRLPPGAGVSACLAGANRDPGRWERPHEYDLFRPGLPHVAFATGVHLCLGIHLARMEMRVALDRVLDLLPGLRLDPSADDVHVSGLAFRSPTQLPVRFDA